MLEVAAGARENRATTGVVLERPKAGPSTLCPFFFVSTRVSFRLSFFFFQPCFLVPSLRTKSLKLAM